HCRCRSHSPRSRLPIAPIAATTLAIITPQGKWEQVVLPGGLSPGNGTSRVGKSPIEAVGEPDEEDENRQHDGPADLRRIDCLASSRLYQVRGRTPLNRNTS